MAECPLPKPNTRVRFPSSAPKRTRTPKRVRVLFSDRILNQNPLRHSAEENVRSYRLPLRSSFAAHFGSDSRHLLLLQPIKIGILFAQARRNGIPPRLKIMFRPFRKPSAWRSPVWSPRCRLFPAHRSPQEPQSVPGPLQIHPSLRCRCSRFLPSALRRSA